MKRLARAILTKQEKNLFLSH